MNAKLKTAAWNIIVSIWHNFETSAEICHMNMSQQCNFMAMVSLQQDKPQHMKHFPLLPTILSALSTSYLKKPLSDGPNST